MTELKEMIGKKVFVILKTGRVYSGIVNYVMDTIISITDKFGASVCFSISELSSMEEEK